MTSEERLEEIRRWRARLAEWRVKVQPLLDEDIERAALESERVVARALRQLRRGY